MAEEFNFDQSPDELEAEIAKIAENQTVKYLVCEGNFVAKFPDGHILKVPIKISMKQAYALDEEGTAPLDQMRTLVGMFGTKEDQEYLEEINMLPAIDFIQKYSEVLQRVQGVSLGESQVSSVS